MKAFIHTTIAAGVMLTLTALVMSVHYSEKHRATTIEQAEKIRQLEDELGTMEVMYLKCAGSVIVEQHGAHYKDGKLKFYKTK